jgi:hypothetical protein
MSEVKNGDPVATFMIQVAALSWAATQVPEITVVIQSLLKAGFLSAVQLELLFMIRVVNPLQRQWGSRVSGILFLNMFRSLIKLTAPAALKRGDKEFVELDAEEAEERSRLDPVECLTAEKSGCSP